MKLDNVDIALIQKALGFELYGWQIDYLKNDFNYMPSDRRTGRTTAYIIKLLLCHDKEINLKRDAIKLKDHDSIHYTDIFIRLVNELNEKLINVGFKTKLYKIDKDADKLSLKLKAIAKHAEALANELDEIDSGINEESDYMKLANKIFLSGLNAMKQK